jgi:hypothetical protein
VLSALAQAAAWLAPAVAIAIVLLLASLWTLRRQRSCPGCRTPMAALPLPVDAGGERPSYEILSCEGCGNTATLVHGQRARFAYCPSCHNRALRAPAVRRPDGSIQVAEHCELCGFRRERLLAVAAPARLGRVIPFPTDRVRRAQDG